MRRKKKKHPTDYPTMGFRISSEDKEKIQGLIDEVHIVANEQISDDERKIKKNELIVDALWLGLSTIKKKYKRL